MSDSWNSSMWIWWKLLVICKNWNEWIAYTPISLGVSIDNYSIGYQVWEIMAQKNGWRYFLLQIPDFVSMKWIYIRHMHCIYIHQVSFVPNALRA